VNSVETLLVFLEIVMINLLLSGDNAVVIAMAGRKLPAHQRRRAVWWGAAAAIILRCGLTLGAIALLNVPFLRTAGALMLFVIAFQLLLEDKEKSAHTQAAATLAGAVWTIVVADFVMSLDNVLAVAAVAKGDTGLLLIGIAMSIPIIIWGSSFIMRMMDRLPWLLYLGGGLLGYTAAEMALGDPGWQPYLGALPPDAELLFPVASVGALLALALWTRSRKHAR